MSAADHGQREVHCDLEIWTRAKCGLRIRSRGRIELRAFLELSVEQRGEAISALLFGAAVKIAGEVEKMDKASAEAQKRLDKNEN